MRGEGLKKIAKKLLKFHTANARPQKDFRNCSGLS
jgi:hypothetical protein